MSNSAPTAGNSSRDITREVAYLSDDKAKIVTETEAKK
jgi:hypothetical protein